MPHCEIILTRDKALDRMEVKVEVTSASFSDRLRELEGLHAKLEAAIEHVLGIRVDVTLVEPRSLARGEGEGEARRVGDRRAL